MLAMPVFAASAGQPSTPARVSTVVRADEKSGRLVRAVVVSQKPAPPIAPAELAATVDRIAVEQGVEESLVHSVIRTESNYNPNAVSPKGAQGIMQLIPATAKRFGVSDTFDPQENIQGGVKYLKFLLDYYRGDYAKAIAAYNAGEGAVDKYHGVPPYAETRNYVSRVAKNLTAARQQRASTAPRTPAESGKIAGLGAVNETSTQAPTSVGSDGRIYYRTP
jgi:soluble lytic murein transglycosylase-like protein